MMMVYPKGLQKVDGDPNLGPKTFCSGSQNIFYLYFTFSKRK